MLFPTVTFALFFLIVYAGHWALRRYALPWKLFLLTASYVFYGWWNWKLLGLIVASSVANHGLAVAMARAGSPRRRHALVVVNLVFNLGMLGFFKYYHFFTAQAYSLCATLHLPCPLPLLDIILPVGISFFTFQALSYVLDVYRGNLRPARSTLDFALYLAFFPQLVAGPIVRAAVLVPQIESPPPALRLDVGRAALLIVVGLFKKVVVANYLATHIVEPVFDFPEAYGGWDALFGIYGYAAQIYCDFSAYSDIAIGVALLMGIHFPINFDAPYFSCSIQEFWRRWHISLSSWLRDYLYIPLGGSRGTFGRTSVNLFLTFLLGGLWHGAGWTFIAWGGLHGFYLTAERVVAWLRGKTRGGRALAVGGGSFFSRLALQLFTFHLVCLSWVFFRSESFDGAWTLLGCFTRFDAASRLVTPAVLVMLALGMASQGADGRRIERLWDRCARFPAWALGTLVAIALTAICALGPKGVAPFIYFQF